MKPKALMLSAAVLLGSVAVAFAQTSSEPPQTPAGPTTAQPGTTVQQQKQQNMNDNAPAGSKSMMNSTGSQAQAQPPRTSKHRTLASRRYERTAGRSPATTALNLLEEKGYRDISSLRPDGRSFEVTANQNGKPVNVVVDPIAKTVRPQG
jgi:hypothetical protein